MCFAILVIYARKSEYLRKIEKGENVFGRNSVFLRKIMAGVNKILFQVKEMCVPDKKTVFHVKKHVKKQCSGKKKLFQKKKCSKKTVSKPRH